LKVLHAYCLNYNIGDYYLGIGVKNLLREFLDVELISETNLQGTRFDEYYINEVVNKKYDLLVIGGGGVIHGKHWPNGWFWLIEERLLDKIKIPFIVYGVGYNYFGEEGGISNIGRSHLLKTIEAAAHFSLRNDGSVERFEEQIATLMPEVPDPGFHINLNKTYSCEETKSFVLIQLANDKAEYRFASEVSKSEFVSDMRVVVSELAERYTVIFTPHVYEDIVLSEEVSVGIPNTKIWSFSSYAFDNAAESLGYYQDAEFVLAMRGHGQIVPIAFNTPVISLENHPKHSGLMYKLGLSHYNVSLSDTEFLSNLKNKIFYLESHKDLYIDTLKALNKTLMIKSAQAFRNILND